MNLVADFWQARGWDIVIKPTEAAGHATELAQAAAAAERHLVVAAGGDGTLGEVANGLAGSPTIMAPLPAGTANSFAKELRLPRPTLLNKHRLLAAVDALAAGRVQQMDLGYTPGAGENGRYWLLWAGVGADGYLVAQIEPRPKWSKRLGTAGYMLQGLFILPKTPVFQATICIDGQQFSGHYLLILCSNARRYVGGMVELSAEAQLDDGRFEIWLFENGSPIRLAQYAVQAKWGDLAAHSGVTRLSGSDVTIHTTPPMPSQTDGNKSVQTPLHIQIRPQALRLLVPNTAPPDLFQHRGVPLR